MPGNDMAEKDKNRMYSVPDGYFAGLEERLARIPSGRQVSGGNGLVRRAGPYIALAASFLLIFAAGTAVLRLTPGRLETQSGISFENLQLADLLPVTSPDIIYGVEDYESFEHSVSDDDITEYLIESGTTIEQLEYYYEESN